MKLNKKTHLLFLIYEMKRFLKLLGASPEDIRNIPLFAKLIEPLDEQLIRKVGALASGRECDILALEEKYKQASPLKSILEDVGASHVKQASFYPITELKLTEAYFPSSHVLENNSQSILKALLNELLHLDATLDADILSSNLLTLLQFYASTTAALPELEDVSFYDFAKTKANLISIFNTEERDEQNPLLLIGGDFSGIQGYIYQIVSKYAGKNLKGRSFYIRLLSEAVVRKIIKLLNLSDSCIIYNSGGSFYLLVANTPNNIKAFKEAEVVIESELLKKHGTSIYVALAYKELSEEVLMNKGTHTLKSIWGELFTLRNNKKRQKFAHHITTQYSSFFTPSGGGGECKIDHITGEEILDKSDCFKFEHPSEEHYVSKLTNKQIELGKNLKQFNYVAVTNSAVAHYDKLGIGIFNYHYYLIKENDLSKFYQVAKDSIQTLYIINANKEEYSILRARYNTVAQAIMYYGGNESENNTFEELCMGDNEYEDASFNRLGVLRMDVDNLGSVFQSGIQDSKLNMARYSTLSRAFDYFFSGYLNSLVKEVSAENLYIIYSGGDDLFIVGQWAKTIELAEAINKKFKQYCNNPTLSISGGISLIPAKFPIMKGAEYSATQESLAKAHTTKEGEKNAISFFNMPLNWTDEYPLVKSLAIDLATEVANALVSKSFLHHLIQFAEDANFEIDNDNRDKKLHSVTNYKVFWMISYQMTRLQETNKKSQLIGQYMTDVYAKQSQVQGKLIPSSYHPIELWAMAARWCELSIRAQQAK